MSQIQNEMVKERASALKEQEVKLAALMAQLQMEKAKEVSCGHGDLVSWAVIGCGNKMASLTNSLLDGM